VYKIKELGKRINDLCGVMLVFMEGLWTVNCELQRRRRRSVVIATM